MNQLTLNFEPEREVTESHSDDIVCPYCEKKRERVNCAMSIDNDFDYSCVVCNLEYLSWRSNGKQNKYTSKKLLSRYNEALRSDEKNNDSEWRPHLKTIAERSKYTHSKTSKGN
jgi:hypothetical protein